MATPIRTDHSRRTDQQGWLPRTIIGIEIFVGIWAIVGGIGLLTGSIGISEDYLDGTFFDSYLIPGLILMVIVAGALFWAATMMWKRLRWAPEASLGASFTLLIWIVVQLAMLGYISWMQPAIFATAVLLGALSWWQIRIRQAQR